MGSDYRSAGLSGRLRIHTSWASWLQNTRIGQSYDSFRIVSERSSAESVEPGAAVASGGTPRAFGSCALSCESAAVVHSGTLAD